MSLKMCVFDIDGVLRNPGGVPFATLVALKKLQDAGIICTVATGRGYARAKSLLESFVPNAPMIVENGGRIVSQEGKTLSFHPMEQETIERCRPILNEDHLLFATFVEREGVRSHFFSDFSREGLEKIDSWPKWAVGWTTNRPNFFIELAKSHECAKIAFLVRAGRSLNVPDGIPYSVNMSAYDIAPYGIDKGTGLKELQTLLEILPSEVLVAGDDPNDIPMFLSDAAIKIAVGRNCPDLLHTNATRLIDGPDNLAPELKQIFPQILD